MDPAAEIPRIVEWIQTKVKEAGAEGCVVGISGGVDSSTVAALCKRAFPNGTLGVLIPFGPEETMEQAELVVATLDIHIVRSDIREAHENLLGDVFCLKPEQKDLIGGNLRSRLRMCMLYVYANINNYLVIGTGNKDEDYGVGYFTKYGDGGVDISPIADFHKSEVRTLARELGIPEEVIEAVPTAGLWEGQTDEGEMGMTYNEIEWASKYLDLNNPLFPDGSVPSGEPFPTERQRQILKMVGERRAKNNHKLQVPPTYHRKQTC